MSNTNKHANNASKQALTTPVVTCRCGLEIPDNEIEYTNGCNDEGEDYCIGTAKCKCGLEYECSEWGECDSLSQAKEDLIEYISSNCN